MTRDSLEALVETPADSREAAEPRREPSPHAAALQSPPTTIDGRLVRYLIESLGNPPLRVSLWNGESIAPGEGDAMAQVHIANRASLLKLLADPEFQFGECFCDGTIQVEGDLVGLLESLIAGLSASASAARSPRSVIGRFRRRHGNSPADARDNIQRHYDLGNDFYRLWLDRGLSYTCAYFRAPDATLEQAQIDKMDHVCRKLRLRPDETVVEAGCGWGALALHMAAHYGVRVRAFNISREQVAHAREQACILGLQQRAEFIEDDYRNIGGRFDAFVSVGMLEHVGPEHFRNLGGVIDRVLEPNGRGLLHSIGHLKPDPLNAWIEKRIFPGAYPPSLREMLEVLEPWSFSVLDVENLRLHYALTLEHWLRRFDAASERVREMYDERFVRAWRLYLCGSQAAFRSGEMQLFQVLFARGRSNAVPWTRAYLYDDARG
ncbi:MAG: class I SAM-dependent methyltransferase [Betaproteobacteria bacterium]|nr:class I SAM-dependent methyltransferase [Betaproteobacteria bacterium]